MEVLAVVELQATSGKPEDKVVNTFVYEYPGTDDPSKDADIIAEVVGFYNDIPTGDSGKVGSMINSSISRAASASRVNLYSINARLGGEPHGSPLTTYNWTLTAAMTGGTDLPAEIALCGSFHSAYGLLSEESGGTRPKQRRRGRIFIGPLHSSACLVESTTNRTRVSPNNQNTLMRAMKDLADNPALNWCQWSRVNQLALSVVGGFVDDAFDVQRRRGPKAITRVTFGGG